MRRLLTLLETDETRLDELVGIKGPTDLEAFKKRLGRLPARWTNTQEKTLRGFVDNLRHLGFKRMGAGAFGVVFTHPNLDYCIKIYRNDLAYASFVKYCMGNPGNPHLPKFRGMVIKIDSKTFAIRMEKLDPLSSNPLRAIEDCLEEYLSDGGTDDPETYIREKMAEEYGKYPFGIPKVREAIRANLGLFQTLHDLGKVKGSFAFDLHDENVMVRDGTTIVIIDPFCETWWDVTGLPRKK